jgi:hypothetical protein
LAIVVAALTIGGIAAACSPDTGAGSASVACAPMTVGGNSEPVGSNSTPTPVGGAPLSAYSPPIGSYSPPAAYGQAKLFRRVSDNTVIAVVGDARFCVHDGNDLAAWEAMSGSSVLDVNDVTFNFFLKNSVNGDAQSG